MSPIDFHSQSNQQMYTDREASLGWRLAITSICDPQGLDVFDVGCGGGIYSRALAEMGASQITAIDSSETMLAAARTMCQQLTNVTYVVGTADAIPLPDASAGMELARGLIHHLPELGPFATEMHRLLKPGGTLIVQDRTPEDIAQPASPENIRGYFLKRFPELLQHDRQRRHTGTSVLQALSLAGFDNLHVEPLQEVRAIHADQEAFLDGVRRREGRSILHELSDTQLDELIIYLQSVLPATGQVVEQDPWTLWIGIRTA